MKRKAHSGKGMIPKNEGRVGLLFVLPFLLGFLLFNIFPLVYQIVLSLTNFNTLDGRNASTFVGLKNFISVFRDPIALASYLRTFVYVLVFVCGINVAGLLVALALHREFYGKRIVTTLILIPYVSNIVAVAIVWLFLFNPFDGPVNKLIKLMGVQSPPYWFGGVNGSLPMIALVAVWHNIAFQTIVILAALQEVPKELHEACTIDGGSALQRFVNVTFPLITPALFFLVVTSTFEAFANYSYCRVLTNGGPGNSSRLISLNIYQQAFTYNRYSFAAAQTILLFIVILLLTRLQWKGQNKWVYYQM
ncbi:MAG: sugar ABC transporter permease [Spirochaetia bacterium]|jgi:multiple sugar transport system permease protein